MHFVFRVLLVLVGAALVFGGIAWILLIARNVHEFRQAGGTPGAGLFAGLPGAAAVGTGLFFFRLAAARYPGSI